MSCPDCEGVGGHDCERYGDAPPTTDRSDQAILCRLRERIEALEKARNKNGLTDAGAAVLAHLYWVRSGEHIAVSVGAGTETRS